MDRNSVEYRLSSLSRTALTFSSSSTAPSSSTASSLSSSTAPSSLSASPILSKALDTSANARTSGSLSSTSTASSAPQSSDKIRVIVGGTIGGVAVLFLTLITGMALIWKRRKLRNTQGPKIFETDLHQEETFNGFEVPGSNGSNELDAVRPPAEIGDARMCHEIQ